MAGAGGKGYILVVNQECLHMLLVAEIANDVVSPLTLEIEIL